MEALFNGLLQLLKLAPRYLAAFAIAAGVLLFGDDELLEQIGLLQFAEDNRSIIGAVFLILGSLAIINFCTFLWKRYNRWTRGMESNRKFEKHMQTLTEDEKQILRFYIAGQTKSNMLRINDGVVQGLKAKRIIIQSAGVGTLHEGFAHNISEAAWDYLNEHQELLMPAENADLIIRNDELGIFTLPAKEFKAVLEKFKSE